MMPHLSYAVVCLVFAYANYREIGIKNKHIRHGINGCLHLAICTYSFIDYGWQVGLCMLFVARLCFDTALNLFRGLEINYVPEKPAAITDKVEKYIFGNDGLLPKFVYIIAITILSFNLFQ